MATANTSIQKLKIGENTYDLPVVDTEASAVLPTNYNAAGVNLLYNAIANLNEKISSISTLKFEIVDELPTEDISKTTIYLVPSGKETERNIYDEYIRLTDAEKGDYWEKIGSTETEVITSYNSLTDKPQINNTTLSGNKTAKVVATKSVSLAGSVENNILTVTASVSIDDPVTIS